MKARIDDRLTLSEALNSVGMMLDSFPAEKGRPDDPEGYEAALAAALCSYPREVAEDCADLKVGVVTECLGRVGLTAGRMHDWCRKNSAALYDFMRREEERRQAARRDSDPPVVSAEERQMVAAKAKAFVEEMRSRMAEAEQPRDEAFTQRQAQLRQREDEARDRFCLAEYIRLGIDPIYDAGGRIANPRVLASMGRLPVPSTMTANADGGEGGEAP